MSFILTATALRATVGIIGIVYSLLKADLTAQTPTVTNEICKSILTGALGNTIYDFIKGGSFTIEQIAKRITSDADNPLNHDLQRAARKAQLTSTLLAVRATQKDLPGDTWLKKLTNILQTKIHNLPKETPSKIVEYEDILTIFDTREHALIQQELVHKLKQDTINELFKLGVEENLSDFSPKAHELLKTKIADGWDETTGDKSLLAKFKSLYSKKQKENLITLAKQYDWFSLVCGLFNEEYKENSRVTDAMQKYLLLDIRDKQGNPLQLTEEQIESINKVFLGHLEQFSDSFQNLKELLRKIDIKQDEILEFVKDNFKDLKNIVESTAKETQRVVFSTVKNTEVNIIEHSDKRFDEIKEILRTSQSLAHEKISKKAKLTPLEKFFFSLKERYQKRYKSKMDERFEISLEVNENWNSQQSYEIQERFNENASEGRAIEIIRNLFERKGRLLIVGSPGAGKTVLLLKLANDLLDKTDLEKKEAFPVIFNLATWSKDYADFRDWLIAMLNRAEGLSKDFAATLLDEGRIILLLDGLDELARNEEKEVAEVIRAKCLDSLNYYLDRGKKVVVCCRRDEFVEMRKATNQDAPVAAKVLINDLTKSQIEDALLWAAEDGFNRAASENLIKILDKDKSGVFLQTLRTPFYFTTAMEVFDRKNLKIEIKDLSQDENQLKTYLISNFIERKLQVPHRKKFNSRKTLKWLGRLARLMDKKQSVTFELADLQPNDLRWSWAFKILFGIITFVFLSAPLIIALNIAVILNDQSFSTLNESSAKYFSSFPIAIVFNAVFVTIIIVLFCALLFLPVSLLFAYRTKIISTEDSSQFSLTPLLQLRTWKAILFTSFLYGLIPSIIFLILSIAPNEPFSKDIYMIAGVFIFAFSVTLMERISNHARNIQKFGNLRKDYQRLKSGIIYNLIRWNVVLVCFIIIGNFRGLWWNVAIFNIWRPVLLFLPFILILILVNNALFKHFVLRFCLTVAGMMPLRYATFLNYAADARILEKDGGQWRFRHQNLQEYFAHYDKYKAFD